MISATISNRLSSVRPQKMIKVDLCERLARPTGLISDKKGVDKCRGGGDKCDLVESLLCKATENEQR